MDYVSWSEKYAPKNKDQIIGNKAQMKNILTFLKPFVKNEKPEKIPNANIIISGGNGVGKTTIIDILLKDQGFDKITADLSSIYIPRKRKNNIKEQTGINKTVPSYYISLGSRSIASFTNKNYKIALVIDNITTINNAKEKEAIKMLAKHNNKYKRYPIIFIVNTTHKKIVNELRKIITYTVKSVDGAGKKTNKKITNEVVIQFSTYDIQAFVKSICIKEKVMINPNEMDMVLLKIINHSQNDFRQLLSILEELKMLYDDYISYDQLESYFNTSIMKDNDSSIFEITSLLLMGYNGVEKSLELHSGERATIPLMIHQNVGNHILCLYPKLPRLQQVEMYFQICKSMAYADYIDGHIYSNQLWVLQPVHGFYACAWPSFLFNQFPKYKLNVRITCGYTKNYNKASIKKINNKVIKKAQSNNLLKQMSVKDFLYFSSIIKFFDENGMNDKIDKIAKDYNLTAKEIESIVKIDKIKKVN